VRLDGARAFQASGAARLKPSRYTELKNALAVPFLFRADELDQGLARVNAGAPEWILARLDDKACSHGIRDDVTNYGDRRFASSHDAFVISLLPQPMFVASSEIESGFLLRTRHERPRICVRRRGLDQQVHVIRHEAVRKNCAREGSRHFQKIRSHAVDPISVCEHGPPIPHATRNKIAMVTAVVERLEAMWSVTRDAAVQFRHR